MLVWFLWAVSLTIVTYAASQAVKKLREVGYVLLTSFYVIYLGASQILASRIVKFDLGFYVFYAPSAVFIYPFVAQAIDMINEAYGRDRARLSIVVAFLTQVLLVVFIPMTNALQPAPFFEYEEAWSALFGLSVRITAASWVSFLVCQYVDTSVFSILKERYEEIPLLRSVVSDLIDLTLDSFLFVLLAFYGVMPVVPLIVGQIASKNFIGFVDTPWFLWYKRMISGSSA